MHIRAEEMSKKEGVSEENSEKQGAAERDSCTACRITNETKCNLLWHR